MSKTSCKVRSLQLTHFQDLICIWKVIHLYSRGSKCRAISVFSLVMWGIICDLNGTLTIAHKNCFWQGLWGRKAAVRLRYTRQFILPSFLSLPRLCNMPRQETLLHFGLWVRWTCMTRDCPEYGNYRLHISWLIRLQLLFNVLRDNSHSILN